MSARALGEQDRRLALVVLVRAQVTAAAEHVVQLVGVARIAGQLPLDLGERVGVDQLAQLFLAEQLAQQVAVERERLCAPLGRGVSSRTCRSRRSSKSSELGNGEADAVSTSTRSSSRVLAGRSSMFFSAGRSNTSCRQLR